MRETPQRAPESGCFEIKRLGQWIVTNHREKPHKSNYVEIKAMASHSSTLAWKIPWSEEPGGLQSMGSLRVGHD